VVAICKLKTCLHNKIIRLLSETHRCARWYGRHQEADSIAAGSEVTIGVQKSGGALDFQYVDGKRINRDGGLQREDPLHRARSEMNFCACFIGTH
jgi:hypothetical protein